MKISSAKYQIIHDCHKSNIFEDNSVSETCTVHTFRTSRKHMHIALHPEPSYIPAFRFTNRRKFIFCNQGRKNKSYLTHENYIRRQNIQLTRNSVYVQEIYKYNCIAHIQLRHTMRLEHHLYQAGLLAAIFSIVKCCWQTQDYFEAWTNSVKQC
jgi:hypothetical protein